MSELENLLVNARIEIEKLRSQNTLLSAKVETFEKCHSFLTARLPEYGHTMSVDVAWELQKYIDKLVLEAKETPKRKDGNSRLTAKDIPHSEEANVF